MFAAAIVYILAVMSPGPNFLLVSRSASSSSATAGIGASVGIAMVGLMFSTSSVIGLAALVGKYPNFSRIATIAGALYLLYIAFMLMKSALCTRESLKQSDDFIAVGFLQSWKMGVLTNVTNMKTVAFMVSIFAGFLSTQRTGVEKGTVIAVCSSFEILWYCSVALIFGQSGIRQLYSKYNRQIDGCLAVFLVFFAGQTVMMH